MRDMLSSNFGGYALSHPFGSGNWSISFRLFTFLSGLAVALARKDAVFSDNWSSFFGLSRLISSSESDSESLNSLSSVDERKGETRSS